MFHLLTCRGFASGEDNYSCGPRRWVTPRVDVSSDFFHPLTIGGLVLLRAGCVIQRCDSLLGGGAASILAVRVSGVGFG